MTRNNHSSGLVYSTDSGRMCPACRKPIASCSCKQARVLAGDGTVRVLLESKGRGGKSVTVVKGVPLDAPALALLGKQLKSGCGSGGTVKDGVIEVQGDHVTTVIDLLTQQGWRVKKAGG